MPEYAWICLNKQDSKYALVINMPEFWTWQGFQYANVTQRSEYARVSFDRYLNTF